MKQRKKATDEMQEAKERYTSAACRIIFAQSHNKTRTIHKDLLILFFRIFGCCPFTILNHSPFRIDVDHFCRFKDSH